MITSKPLSGLDYDKAGDGEDDRCNRPETNRLTRSGSGAVGQDYSEGDQSDQQIAQTGDQFQFYTLVKHLDLR